MFFKFLVYLKPNWYFLLSPNNGFNYLIDVEKLTMSEKRIIVIDEGYESYYSTKLDAAYQAFQKGFIDSKNAKLYLDNNKPTIVDNYRFVKKYFHSFWVYYVFFIRLFCLKNPIKELNGLYKSLNVKRVNLYKEVYNKLDFDKFKCTLIHEKIKVSVIIPTLNRYQYLKVVLQDLEKQTYKNFEVLIVDQSDNFDLQFYDGWNLDLKIVNQKEKALWKARNSAIKNSIGEIVLLYDDDSLVDKYWIENHLKCLDFFKCEISSGVSLSKVGAKVPEHYIFFRWGDQIDTGNVMIKKEVFRKIGLFDRQFEKQRMGDGEFGLRAYLAGFKNISNPYSKRIHLKVKDGGLREMGSWDAFRPTKIFAPRPIPSVLYLTRKYFGNRIALFFLIKNIPPSIIPYKYKNNNMIFIIGLLFSVVLFPILFISINKSWKLSSLMIKEGSLIDTIQ